MLPCQRCRFGLEFLRVYPPFFVFRSHLFLSLLLYLPLIFVTTRFRKHHGQNEEKRGQVDIIPEDFALIPAVLNEYDTAEHTGEDKIGNKKLLEPVPKTEVLGKPRYSPKRLKGLSTWQVLSGETMKNPGASSKQACLQVSSFHKVEIVCGFIPICLHCSLFTPLVRLYYFAAGVSPWV
jgi:hypothetical protein